jgi:DUF1680 family protein
MTSWTDRYRNDRRNAPPAKLKALGLQGAVTLHDGPFADRVANAQETYLAIPADDILHGFRVEADLPSTGKPMTGWASQTSAATFGQWVSGMARLAAATDNPDLAQRAVDLLKGWEETLPASGDTKMHVYGWEKAVCGLVDTALYVGYDEALEVLARVTGFAAANFDRTRAKATPADFAGDGPQLMLEWYTLAENLHRGYLAGGDPLLQEFANVWHYDAYWALFEEAPAAGQPWPVPVWLHAYSHLNTFASAAAAYEVTGDERLLTVLRNAHDYFTTTQCYATGGFGPSEFTMPEDGSLGRSLEWRTDTAEIVCGSWAAFKLCSALMKATGEAKYSDWVEQLLYSGLGATTPVTIEGVTPYYQDYRLGISTKLPHWDAWPCCSGTYVQAVSQISDLIYYTADDGVSVALFVPSEVRFQHAGATVLLRQSTGFPEEDTTTLTVNLDRPTEFTLRIRVPQWTEGMRVRLNGEPVQAACVPGTWAEVARTWSHGDTLEVTIGAGLRAIPVDRWHPNRVALAHGPVVLAQDGIWTSPLSAIMPWQATDLDRLLTRTGEGLHYDARQVGTNRQPVGGFLPLSEIPDRQPHRVYLDLDRPRII